MISSRILTQCVVRLQACSTAGLRIADCSQNVLARSHALPSAISESSRNGDVLSVSSGFEPLLTQVRHRNIRRRIMGHPRPPIFGKITPEPNKYRYTPVLPKDGHYTTAPLPIIKLGGRDPITKRVVVRTIGGGNKNNFRWVDFKRHAPEGETIEEKVYNVRYDPLNTFLIALVANGGHRRWIIASENMKPGDIIKTTNIISRNPVRVTEGDTWPLGAIPPGTIVHNIEQIAGEGGFYSKYAGAGSEVIRRMGTNIVIKLASNKEIALDQCCMASIGRVSQTEHNTVNLLIPQRVRWKGNRMRSGLWHRKDGYCGRKIRPPKPLQIITAETFKKKEIHYQPMHLL